MSAYVVEQRLPGSDLAANRDWRCGAVIAVLEHAEIVADRARRLWAVMGAEVRVVDLDTGRIVDRV